MTDNVSIFFEQRTNRHRIAREYRISVNIYRNLFIRKFKGEVSLERKVGKRRDMYRACSQPCSEIYWRRARVGEASEHRRTESLGCCSSTRYGSVTICCAWKIARPWSRNVTILIDSRPNEKWPCRLFPSTSNGLVAIHTESSRTSVLVVTSNLECAVNIANLSVTRTNSIDSKRNETTNRPESRMEKHEKLSFLFAIRWDPVGIAMMKTRLEISLTPSLNRVSESRPNKMYASWDFQSSYVPRCNLIDDNAPPARVSLRYLSRCIR